MFSLLVSKTTHCYPVFTLLLGCFSLVKMANKNFDKKSVITKKYLTFNHYFCIQRKFHAKIH